MTPPEAPIAPLREKASPSGRPDDRPWLSRVLFVAVLVATVAVFFRLQILNGFSVLFSDRYDGVIEDAVLEHWLNVVRGLAAWSEANYFYPNGDTLGYTDGYFLYGLAHALFREIGFDPFLSSELVNIVVKTVGFVSFFAACRRIFGLSFAWALFGAALFTLSHASFIQAGHAQLLSVSFVPVVALLLWEGYRALLVSDRRKLLNYGCCAGVFFGAWLLTAFYMAWFFAFFCVFLVAALLIIGEKPAIETLRTAVRKNYRSLAVVGLVAAVALTPFLAVYLHKAQETGVRSADGAIRSTLAIKDIVNVGPSNFLYGGAYTAAVRALCPTCDTSVGEQTTGVTPLLLIVVIACCAWLWRERAQPSSTTLLRGLALASIVTWVLCIHLRSISGWYFVYQLFPGAKALRVVSRYQIFLTAPLVALVACYLANLARRIPKPVMIVLCALLLVGELDSGASGTVALERGPENLRTSASAPPQACKSFFVTAARDQDSATLVSAVYPHNVDAMMIAERVNLPTINGFASFNPQDWDFAYPNNPDYLARIERYAAQHHLDGLCRLDLTTMIWQENWR